MSIVPGVQNGQENHIVIAATPDGVERPFDGNPAFADSICYAFTDPFTLDSTAKKDGEVVGYARRVLSPDGRSMRIVQSGPLPDGASYENVSFYNRMGEA